MGLKRFLKWAAVAIGALVIVVMVLYALSRALGASDQQERALALMSERDSVTGTNAFAALWLMPYDVPPGQVAAIAAEDVKRFNSTPAPGEPAVDDGSTITGLTSVAEGEFERHPLVGADLPEQCREGPVACLQRVSAQVADYQRWRERNQALIERAALDGSDYVRNLFGPRIDRPWPDYMIGVQARRTSHALDFALGDRDAAFSGVCHDINTWRRLGPDSDDLLMRMVAFGAVEGSMKMFAEMLARGPADQSLPAACEVALAPPRPQELSICAAMKGEFAFMRGGMAAAGMGSSNLLYDRHATEARSATYMAVVCDDAVQRAITEDQPLPEPMMLSDFDFACIGNPTGCILTNMAAPAYQSYLERAQETGAKMRLASTVYWLRTHPDDPGSLAERLAGAPAELTSPQHPVEIINDGQGLRIALKHGAEGSWELPLSAPAGQPSATFEAR